MKKIVSYIVVIAVLTSCIKETFETGGLINDGRTAICASLNQEKTCGESEILFEPYDSLSVFDDKGGNNPFIQDGQTECTAKATFYGMLPEKTSPYLAVYPYCKEASVIYGNDYKSGSTEGFGREYTVASTFMPEHFEAKFSNSVLHGAALSIGRVTDNGDTKTLTLKNVVGLAGIEIPENISGIHNVEFSSLEGKQLSGQIRINCSEESPKIESVSQGGCKLDFNALRADCDSIVSGRFYFPLIPDTYRGIQLRLSLLDGSFIEKVSYTPLIMIRSHCLLMGKLKLEDIQKVPSGPVELTLDFQSKGAAQCLSLFRKIGEQTSYLPDSSSPNTQGATYYFRDGEYTYPLYIFSHNSDGTLSHSWSRAEEALLLKGGAKDAFLSTPALPGKKLSAVRLAAPHESVHFKVVTKKGLAASGLSGSEGSLGEWVTLDGLGLEDGQSAKIRFEGDDAAICRIEFKYDETVSPEEKLPEYYYPYIDNVAARINGLIDNQASGFFFWTDTHLDANHLQTPSLINYLMKGNKDIPVFWGGDGNIAYSEDVFALWARHKELFAKLSTGTKLLLTHGNHDIHAPLSKEATTGHWMSKAEVYNEFRPLMPSSIVRNENDQNSLYYYYDAPRAPVRYIFLDTFDTFNATLGAKGLGVSSGFSSTQFDWIFKTAVLKAPKGYKLVFVSHCNPVITSYGVHKSLKAALKALAAHEDYEGLKFSGRPDLDVLLTIGGHYHHDMQISCSGCWNVMTICDARYGDGKKNPFADPSVSRVKGTISEQAFDYVSVSKDYSCVEMIRIGDGGNRCYHCGAIHLKPGETVKLSAREAVEWRAYDSDSKKGDSWILTTDVATVSNDGTVFAHSAGESEIVAMDANHNLELFAIIVDGDNPVINLSENGLANCYLVTEAGTYKFNASTKGNGEESIGEASSAELLWDESNSIQNIYLRNACVYFSVKESFNPGNALIAVKDNAGNILWSWHIWCTQEGFKEQAYGNSAGIVMDRNLGSAANSLEAEASGLFYQWGRKDPFRHCSVPTVVTSDKTKGTIAYSVSHPTHFICRNLDSEDWQYASEDGRWAEGKTIYDPCPYGWKVPAARIWVTACKSRSKLFNCGDWLSSGGMDFTSAFGTETTCLYPAAGMLSGTDGALKYSGEAGFWWAIGSEASAETGLMINKRNYVIPVCYDKADGHCIRCIKE